MMEMERLYDALRKADAAGDAESSRRLSAYIRETRINQMNAAETQDQAFGQAGIERQLDAPFDPSQGVNDFWKRFDLARTVSPQDREAKLQAQMPGADVRTVTRQPDANTPGKPLTVFRPEGEEAFRPINQQGLTTGDFGAGLGLLANEETLGAISGVMATRGFGLPVRAVGQMIGSGFGRAVQEGVEGVRGFNTDSLGDIGGRIGMSTGMGLAGELSAGPLSRLGNVVSRREGVIAPSPGVMAGQRAIEEEGLHGATLGQLHPLLARRENQLSMTTSPVRVARGEQLAEVRDAQTRLRDTITGTPGDAPRFSEGDLDNTVRALGRDLESTVTSPNVSMREGGAGLQQGLDEFRGTSQAWVSNKYNRALEYADDVTFSMDDVMESVSRIRRGTPMDGADPTEVIGPSGAPVTQMHPVDVRAEGKTVQGVLKGIMDDLEIISNAPQQGRRAAEGLIVMRGRLRGLLDQNWAMADAQTRAAMREGQDLYTSLTNAIENPQSGNTTFSSLWRSANNSNRWKEGILSTADAVRIADTATPEDLMRFAAPGNTTTLRTLRRVLPEDKWAKFQDGYVTELMSAPDSINRRLNTFRHDPDALNLLVSPGDQQSLRTYGEGWEKINKFQGILSRQTDDGARMLSMLDTVSPDQVDVLLRQAGGPDSPQGRNLRAGVVQGILERTETYNRDIGRMVADPSKIGVIDEYLKNPAVARLLQPAERANLENYSKALHLYKGSGSDVGAGMAAGSLASRVLNFVKGITGVALLEQSSAAVQARLFTQPWAGAMLFGTGQAPTQSTTLRATATMAYMLGKDFEKQGAWESGADPEQP